MLTPRCLAIDERSQDGTLMAKTYVCFMQNIDDTIHVYCKLFGALNFFFDPRCACHVVYCAMQRKVFCLDFRTDCMTTVLLRCCTARARDTMGAPDFRGVGDVQDDWREPHSEPEVRELSKRQALLLQEETNDNGVLRRLHLSFET